MKKVLALTLYFFVFEPTAQTIEPQIMALQAFGREYLPEIRKFDPRTDDAVTAKRIIQSPHQTKTVAVLEESDLTEVTYDTSFAKAALIIEGKPALTIELSRYRSFDISWLNEELIQISVWPGRCVELHTIFSTLDNRPIYEQGFQICGV